MNKIEIAIIGTQKSGTSSLNKYLALHPEFVTHSSLEFPYFVNDELYHKGYEHAMGEYFDNSELNSKIIIKSVGIIYDEEALRRLKDHNPDVKIIITLRHPVDRAYSAYWYACRYGWEKEPSFEKSLWQKSQQENWIGNRFCDYINRSEYSKHIKTVYDHFPERQVLYCSPKI
ncbi:MAG: sulfotransferase domain-containing protein [Cyclobacteriaceae bacterium]|nr:sulfotransferase domain-containing protein [Cyclobacteriaceae bacterium]